MSNKPVLIINGKKRCSACGQIKSIDHFHKATAAKSGLSYVCKECREKLRREIYSKKPHSIRASLKSWLKVKYKITLEEFDEMFDSQRGVCKICGSININGRRLAVDHDHKTGKVRGLLCADCNLTLGYVKDDISILIKMIEYLQMEEGDNPNPTAS